VGCYRFGESLVASSDADCGRVVLEYPFDLCFTMFGSDTTTSEEDIGGSRGCVCCCKSLGYEFDGGLKHDWIGLDWIDIASE